MFNNSWIRELPFASRRCAAKAIRNWNKERKASFYPPIIGSSLRSQHPLSSADGNCSVLSRSPTVKLSLSFAAPPPLPIGFPMRLLDKRQFPYAKDGGLVHQGFLDIYKSARKPL